MFFGLGLFAWLVIGVLVVASFILAEIEYYTWNALVLISGLIAAYFFFGLNVMAIFANPVTFAIAVFAYFIIGAGVSTLKFLRYCKVHGDEAAEGYKRATKGTSTTYEEFAKDRHNFILHPSRHYSKLVAWLVYWPEYVLLFVLKEPFVYIGRMISSIAKTAYRIMAQTYGRIATAALKAALGKNASS